MTADLEATWEAVKAAGGIKRMMQDRGIRHGRCRCPSCGAKGKCEAALAGPRDHLHMRCTACGWGMME